MEKYIEITKYVINEEYSKVTQVLNNFEKRNKKEYKKIVKNTNKNVLFLKETEFFNGIVNGLFGNYLNYLLDGVSNISFTIENISINELLRDKDFEIFFKKILNYSNILEVFTSNNKEELDNFDIFFSSFESIVLSYFFIKEKNISKSKLLNIYSYFFKGSKIKISDIDLTPERENIIKQITTGIKYEKEKPVNNNDYEGKRSYKKSNKFNILQYLSTRITIKYFSEKKPQSQKEPHYRRETIRRYESGLVVKVKGSFVNEKLLVS